MERCSLLILAACIPFAAFPQVVNPGFESGVSGWVQPCVCAPFVLSNDVPPGGGSVSFGAGIVDLNCICTVTDAVHQPVPWLLPGQWVLSAWIKNADPGNIPGVAVRISEGPAFSSNVLGDAWSAAGVWTLVVDTFTVGPFTDLPSLQLSLIPDDGNAMPPGLFAYFDQITIELILSTGAYDHGMEVIRLYPVPAGSSVSFIQDGPLTEVLIADALGRSHRLTDLSRNKGIITLDVGGLSPGAWLLYVITPEAHGRLGSSRNSCGQRISSCSSGSHSRDANLCPCFGAARSEVQTLIGSPYEPTKAAGPSPFHNLYQPRAASQ